MLGVNKLTIIVRILTPYRNGFSWFGALMKAVDGGPQAFTFLSLLFREIEYNQLVPLNEKCVFFFLTMCCS
jgi:hypothetical protein